MKGKNQIGIVNLDNIKIKIVNLDLFFQSKD